MDRRTVTTLCYLERDGRWLMLHRTKKENDINRDKYIGVGGHLEHGESPEDCVRREILEETGLQGGSLRLRGLLTFVIDDIDELSFLYTGEGFSGEPRECDEGELVWLPKTEMDKLPMWEGDRIITHLTKKRMRIMSRWLQSDPAYAIYKRMDSAPNIEEKK